LQRIRGRPKEFLFKLIDLPMRLLKLAVQVLNERVRGRKFAWKDRFAFVTQLNAVLLI